MPKPAAASDTVGTTPTNAANRTAAATGSSLLTGPQGLRVALGSCSVPWTLPAAGAALGTDRNNDGLDDSARCTGTLTVTQRKVPFANLVDAPPRRSSPTCCRATRWSARSPCPTTARSRSEPSTSRSPGATAPLLDPMVGLQLEVARCPQAWQMASGPSASARCSSTPTTIVPDRPLLGRTPVDRTLVESDDPGGVDYLRASIRLPDTAPASLAGQRSTVTLAFVAGQRSPSVR